MSILLTRTTVTEQFQVKDLPHGALLQILQGLSNYDREVEHTRNMKRATLATLGNDDEITIEEQEEEAMTHDKKANDWEYRKRKNRFIEGESSEDNRGGKGRKRRVKLRVIESDDEEQEKMEIEDELTFEDETLLEAEKEEEVITIE